MLLETTCYHMYGYKSLLPNGNKTLYSWDSIMVPKWSTADNKRDPKYLWNTVLFTELSQTCSSLLNGSHTGQIPAWSQEQPAKQPATHFCWVLSEFLAGLGRIPNLSASGSSQAPGIWTAADSLSNKSTVRSSWEVEIRISLRWSLPHLADCTSLLSLSWGGQHWCHKQDPAGLETSRCNKAESKTLQGSVPLSDSVSPPVFRLGTDNALMMCCRKAKESTLPASVDLHSKAISLILTLGTCSNQQADCCQSTASFYRFHARESTSILGDFSKNKADQKTLNCKLYQPKWERKKLFHGNFSRFPNHCIQKGALKKIVFKEYLELTEHSSQGTRWAWSTLIYPLVRRLLFMGLPQKQR